MPTTTRSAAPISYRILLGLTPLLLGLAACGNGSGPASAPGGGDPAVDATPHVTNASLSPAPHSVELAWEPTGAEAYNVYWSSAADFVPENYALYPDGGMAAGVAAPYRIEGLRPDTNYYFYIGADVEAAELLSERFDTRTPVPGVAGGVRTVAQTEARIFIGGDFDEVGSLAGNLQVLDLASGQPRARPYVIGSIHAISPVGDGGYVIGGDFRSVDGVERRYLARLDGSGAVVPGWSPPADIDDDVYAVALDADAGVLYIGGEFRIDTPSGDRARNLAAVDLETGAVLDWAVEMNREVFDLLVHDGVLFAAGRFTEVHEAVSGTTYSRDYVAAFDLAADRAVMSWRPRPNARVHSIAAWGHAGERLVAIGGEFDAVDEDADHAHFAVIGEDARPRQAFAGQVDGDVHAIALGHERIYLGGRFEQPAEHLAAIGLDGAVVAGWPHVSPDGNVESLLVEGDHLYVGGRFLHLGEQARARLARLEVDGSLSAGFAGRFDDRVTALAASQGRLLVGGRFRLTDTKPHQAFAVLGPDLAWEDGWPTFNLPYSSTDGIHDILIRNERVYVGGQFAGAHDAAGEQDQIRNLAAIDRATRQLSGWPATYPGGTVFALAAGSSDSIFVGGAFTSWGAKDVVRLARVGAGGALAGSMPEPDGAVRALAYHPQTQHLYIAGSFDHVLAFNPAIPAMTNWPSDSVARVEAGHAYAGNLYALDAAWHPALSFTGSGTIHAIDLDLETSLAPALLVAGAFTGIGDSGGTRPYDNFAAVSAADGGATVLAWDAGVSDYSGTWAGRSILARTDWEILIGGANRRVSGHSLHAAARLTDGGSFLGALGDQGLAEAHDFDLRSADGRLCIALYSHANELLFGTRQRRGLACVDQSNQLAW